MIVYMATRCHHIFLSPFEPSAFIPQCHMRGSVRISCRFQKYLIMITPPHPLLSLLPYVASRIAFIFLTLIQLLFRSTQKSRRWDLGMDFRFEHFADSEVGLLTCLVWVWILSSVQKCSSGVEKMLSLYVPLSPSRLPPGVTTGNNHVQMLTRNRNKTHMTLLILYNVFIFYFLFVLIHDETWWMFQ